MVSAVVPGVMGQTGMETLEIVQGDCKRNEAGSCYCSGCAWQQETAGD